jgi:hypothetical protein
MAFELRENEGSLWKNDRREKDTHANARGQCKINGVIYYVNAWTNTTKDGTKYQSLKFKPRDDQPQHSPTSDETASLRDKVTATFGAPTSETVRDLPLPDDLDEDLPF